MAAILALSFFVGDYENAMVWSKVLNKPVLIYFTADWCAPCKAMKEVYKEPEVKKSLGRFICVKVEVTPTHHLVQRFQISSIPAWISTKHKRTTFIGKNYMDKASFLSFLEAVK